MMTVMRANHVDSKKYINDHWLRYDSTTAWTWTLNGNSIHSQIGTCDFSESELFEYFAIQIGVCVSCQCDDDDDDDDIDSITNS